jgi:hypothetical protein
MHRRCISACTLSGLLALGVLGLACADSDHRSQAAAGSAPSWTRIGLVGHYSFEGDVLENEDLSGIACLSDMCCLVGADEGHEVQLVELARRTRTLTVRRTVQLPGSGAETDIEAIAAEGDSFFIVGSHGVAKKTGEYQASRCQVFRLRLDPVTGSTLALDVASLSNIIATDPVLGPYFRQPLQRRGVNIEGLAVREGRLFFGFRSPNLDGVAFVLEISAADVFDPSSKPRYTLRRLNLGNGLGIREIVAARRCFLIIAGNAGSEPSEKYIRAENYRPSRGYTLFTWDGRGADVHKVGPIPNPPGKAEAMTVLEESADHATVLILFDGLKRGRPSIYRIE